MRLKIASLAPATIKIDGEFRQQSDTWSFLNTYGRVIGLGERIEKLTGVDSVGDNVAVRKTGPAEFKSEKPVSHFTYEVRLPVPPKSADCAHVSWLNEQGGYLMFADLLPLMSKGDQRSAAVRVEFQLPTNWGLASSLQADRQGRYEVSDSGQAVFFVGRELRVKRKQIGSIEFLFASLGEWPFSIDSVNEVAAKIIKDHTQHVGFGLTGRATLMLSPFPEAVGAERWSAETRGTNVVLLFGQNSPREVLLGRLSVVLTHELFHLWVPNALALDGDYDWFFEGFTLYQALRSAVRLGFIDFEEYLSTMARVYDSHIATPEGATLSLIEGSQRRWTTAPSFVYDKGMLVALLCDLGLRSASKNRRSLDNVYRELLRQHPLGTTRVDGNQALINLINREEGDVKFTRRYILTPGVIRLETELRPYGLLFEMGGNRSHLKVDKSLNSEQLGLLGSLGYRKPRK